MAEIAFLSLTAAALLAAALLLDFVAHRRWFRRRQSLAGRVVLITGAAGGLGRELALHFAREGATVALWDVRADALDEVFEWLTRTHKVAPSAVRRTVVDVADRRAVERAAAELAHACGAVRVLVNNAAIVCGDALLAGSSADSLERTLRVNIEGAFWVVRALAAPMLAAGGGTVVTVGSVVAYMVMTYLLYLRLSGQFHIAIGLIHLFGFDLPETHRKYLLASSVSDFWRRINIYWKDFIVKLFYLPVFFRLRRSGEVRAAAVATVVAFAATWALHSWQWYWLLGSPLLTWPDTLFWAILGGMMVFATVQETRRGGRPPQRSRIGHAVAVVRTFVLIVVLWSLWQSSSLEAWWQLVSLRGGA